MQFIIVVVAITLSVAYMAWRIYSVLTSRKSTCANCQGCPLMAHGHHSCNSCKENMQCRHKKTSKNLEK